MAVQELQREELISSKQLTVLSIICHLLVIYQPGGLAEKALILRSLELPAEAVNLSEAVQRLRRWSDLSFRIRLEKGQLYKVIQHLLPLL